MVQLCQRHVHWVENLLADKLIMHGIMATLELHLYCPDLKRLPLDNNIVSVM